MRWFLTSSSVGRAVLSTPDRGAVRTPSPTGNLGLGNQHLAPIFRRTDTARRLMGLGIDSAIFVAQARRAGADPGGFDGVWELAAAPRENRLPSGTPGEFVAVRNYCDRWARS